MKTCLRTGVWAAWALLCLAGVASAGATPVLVSATYLGSAGDDRIEGIAFGPDGTIYVAGTSAEALASLPPGAKLRRLGLPDEGSTYGCGFVARLDPDGRRLLAAVQFAKGIAKPTTVEVSAAGVYVGGYAAQAIEPVLAPLGGLLPRGTYDQRRLQLRGRGIVPAEHYNDNRFSPAGDGRGVPFVVRLSADLEKLECGTLLEGWQSVWFVPEELREDWWQPVGIGLLPGGDVVVCHDGGYCRMPAAGDRPTPADFYLAPDHLSRLSPDLKGRRWKKDLYLPQVDPARADRYVRRASRGHPLTVFADGWKHASIGQTRVLRLRVDAEGNVYAGGWSPSRTSSEPWWCPFLLKLNGDGEVIGKAYTPDPMSGPEGRLRGLVSDAAIRTVAVDDEGNLLVSGIGDGGNSVLRQDPRDYAKPAPTVDGPAPVPKGTTQPTAAKKPSVLKGMVSGFRGRMLFWGVVTRVDGRTFELLGGNHVAGSGPLPRRWGRDRGVSGVRPAWAADLAALPGGRVVAVGRHMNGFRFTPDAWREGEWGSFLRVYEKDFALAFSTSLPDADLSAVARRGSRCAMVGSARSGKAPVRNALCARPLGGRDGYLVVADFPEKGPAMADDLRAEIDERIERVRKGDFSLACVDEAGRALADRPVSVRLKRHHFLFGTCVGGDPTSDDPDERAYFRFIADHFTGLVCENAMKWYAVEPRRDELRFAPADRLLAFAEANGLAMRGHCLFWSKEKFVARQGWLLKLKGDELRKEMDDHLVAIVGRYKGRLAGWDVNNEMLDGSWYKQALGEAIRPWMFKRAHELDEGAGLFVNEYGLLAPGDEKRLDQCIQLIEHLRKAGAPVGGIGIQEHQAERFVPAAAADAADDRPERQGRDRLYPRQVLRRLDRLGELGLPIHITEVSSRAKDPQRRAESLEIFCRLAFSHPKVEAFMLWGFWARRHWLGPDAALVDRDWTLNPAGQRLFDLLRKEWRTDVDGRTDESGRLHFRGFFGTYEVAIDEKGAKLAGTARLTPVAPAAKVACRAPQGGAGP